MSEIENDPKYQSPSFIFPTLDRMALYAHKSLKIQQKLEQKSFLIIAKCCLSGGLIWLFRLAFHHLTNAITMETDACIRNQQQQSSKGAGAFHGPRQTMKS